MPNFVYYNYIPTVFDTVPCIRGKNFTVFVMKKKVVWEELESDYFLMRTLMTLVNILKAAPTYGS